MENKQHGIVSVVVMIAALLLTPSLIFTALPNMFFGFENSETDAVLHMTEQAKMIGSVYMSLENFEKSQIDSLVTGIAAEYEASGNTIDRIEVKSSFEEDDLLWLIAINSVLHQQDLDSMSAVDIRQFCTSRLTVGSLLEAATLKVEIQKIDPEQLMERLGFDDAGIYLCRKKLHRYSCRTGTDQQCGCQADFLWRRLPLLTASSTFALLR